MRTTMHDQTVSLIKWKNHIKILQLEPSGTCITVPLSACVGQGDIVQIANGDAYVLCKNGLCKILPTYISRDAVYVGSSKIELLVKEITDLEEREAMKSLTYYHYRGARLFGRTARLIARSFNSDYPKVLGYIELATPFYMNKARSKILDAPFNYNGISWEHWDKETVRKYIHIMVRIARCVIYPEFRGLGLGQMLVEHAIEFAKNRWQMSGFIPYFLEISADMLKFVPFVEKAGMVFIGETEGNLGRVYKDMEYLTRNVDRVRGRQIVLQEAFGIVDRQVNRMNNTLSIIEECGLDREEVLRRLKNLSKNQILRDFSLFHNIVSLPKPSYMKGLNLEADEFLIRRVGSINPRSKEKSNFIRLETLNGSIMLKNLTLSFTTKVRRTKLTHSIQQAFGISPDHIDSIIIRKLSLQVRPGEIILVIGPSGSGKTAFIDFLAKGAKKWQGGNAEGLTSWPTNYRPGIFKTIRSHKALIELMLGRDVRSALYLMGSVGLSDAFIYLKRFHELSRGQQYRVMLAKMMAEGYNVWLIDEFCANLDYVTANVIADKLQQVARELGATVVVAAPHYDAFLSTLKPDKVIKLTTAWEHEVISGSSFLKACKPIKIKRDRIISFPIRSELLEAVRLGKKVTTIREGRKPIEAGILLLEAINGSLAVRVTEVHYKTFQNLTDEDAIKDGYCNKELLKRELLSIYPTLRPRSFMTLIEFEKMI